MPRSPRIVPVGTVCHVINRGNDRRQIFFEKDEYSAFVELLGESKRRYPIGIYAHQTLPNHFHLILEPLEEGAISAALHWIGTRSSSNYREITLTRGYGHVFQRRFWSRLITNDRDYLTAVKYVESNALRAGLVQRAQDWRWGSLWERVWDDSRVIDPSPVPLPDNWVELVNVGLTPEELTEIRRRPRPGRKPARRLT
jgi:putative transposase